MLYVLCPIILFVNCNVIKTDKRDFGHRIINQLFEENGNVFYMSSIYIKTYFVWSYTNKGIIVYKLSGKKVLSKNKYENSNILNFEIFQKKDELFELDKCMELDGDILCYKIKVKTWLNNKKHQLV